MGSVVINIDSSLSAADLTAKLQGADSQSAVQNLINFLNGLSGGASFPAALNLQTGGAKASGTATFGAVVAGNSITIAGVAFTAVASGATGNQFNVGGNSAQTAANATAVINANATLKPFVKAIRASNVITITELYPGTIGNLISLAQSGGTITLSGATLTGGTQGTEKFYNFGLTL